LVDTVAIDRMTRVSQACAQTSRAHSTVTDFARFLGWSTFAPRFTAM
jgi:hypothetical protein